MAIVKFQVPIWVDSETGQIEIVSTTTFEDWLKRNTFTVKEIKLDIPKQPPYWHQFPNER